MMWRREIHPNARKQFKGLWFERAMALLALANLGLVLFDLSYIPWRDFYLRRLPQLTEWYGRQFKGIEPHRMTTAYLDAVQQLEEQVALTGLQSPEVNQQLLNLQRLSVEMVDENPFDGANKTGILERIKNRMRDQVRADSSKQAFTTFWSQDYLMQAGWNPSLQFFQQEIQPLLATNYYRHIGENGEPIDWFWKIDIWFVGIFAAEFLARTFYLSRRYKRAGWIDAVIWRCYDLLLLLPFWRWLRVIPVVIRLDQAKLINLKPINNRVVRILISSVVVELTEMVVVQVIDQTQDIIRRGDATRWLLRTNRYIDLNGVNEVEVIAKHLTNVMVYNVLPQLRPEVEALLGHSVSQILQTSPAYASLQKLPGVSHVSQQITQQIVSDVSQTTYQAIRTALEDDRGTTLTQQLIHRLGEIFTQELKQHDALAEIEALTVALLDEVKVNYVKRLEAEDYEKLLQQKTRIYEITQSARLD
ncbi:hypothetical protein [Leptolyngbya sp. NK1-12]|nr:hypothetical protein [Leptolyngbya sp. NK1-12]